MNFRRTLFYSALDFATRALMSIVIMKIVALRMGASGVLIFGQFQTFTVILSTLAGGALVNGIIKYVAVFREDIQRRNEFLTSVVFIVGVVGCLLMILAMVFLEPIREYFFQGQIEKNVLFAALVLTIPSALNILIYAIFNGVENPKLLAQLRIFSAIMLLITLGVFYFVFDAKWIFLCMIIGPLMGSVYGMYLLRVKLSFRWIANLAVERKTIINLSKYYVMGGIAIYSVPATLVLVRNIYVEKVGFSELGLWEGVSKICDQYLFFISSFLSLYFLPKVAKSVLPKELRELFFRVLRHTLMFVFLSVIPLYFLRFQLIQIFLSKGFFGSEKYFLMQLLISIAKVASWIIGFVLIGRSQFVKYVAVELSFAVLWSILAYFLRERGVEGLQESLLMAYIGYIILSLWFVWSEISDKRGPREQIFCA